VVQIFQPEELPVTQRGHDPAFDYLYANLDLRLVESHRMQLVWEPPQASSE
jgi:hypothetical protein